MKQHRSQHNTATLFGVEEIPSDNRIRSLLDEMIKVFYTFDMKMIHEKYCTVVNSMEDGGG